MSRNCHIMNRLHKDDLAEWGGAIIVMYSHFIVVASPNKTVLNSFQPLQLLSSVNSRTHMCLLYVAWIDFLHIRIGWQSRSMLIREIYLYKKISLESTTFLPVLTIDPPAPPIFLPMSPNMPRRWQWPQTFRILFMISST